jgi:predicted GNAT family N-acyltransferase
MDFYIKHGFVPEGPEFIEADIPHIKLRFNP